MKDELFSDNKLFGLTNDEKAMVLDNFINTIDKINHKSGVVLGSYQVLEMLDSIAVDLGYVECPTCHQKSRRVGDKHA
jgi:uncharacterized protein (UPF0212 family)